MAVFGIQKPKAMKNIRILSSLLFIFTLLFFLGACDQQGRQTEDELDTLPDESLLERQDRSSAEFDVKLELGQSDKYGRYLTDGQGRALYMFKADSTLTSNCYDDCADVWPPFTVDKGVLPLAGSGVDQSLIGTFERRDGDLQVAYAGWPLYYYEKDQGPGQTEGQDIKTHGAEWYLVGPEGNEVHGNN